MHDQFDKLVIKTAERDKVYIVEKIANKYDSFALYSNVQRNADIVFSAQVNVDMKDQRSASDVEDIID